MPEAEPPSLRASDADRERVSEVLRDALAAGRIDVEELHERLDATYAARTMADLARLTEDLPDTVQQTPRLPDRVVAGPERTRHVAIMSGLERRGDWVVPRELAVTCFWGGADLDLRDARFAAREVVISVYAVMGGANITVDEDTEVVLEGLGVMGGFSGPSSIVPADPDAAVTVRIRGVALMGGVSVQRKPPESDEPRRRKRLH